MAKDSAATWSSALVMMLAALCVGIIVHHGMLARLVASDTERVGVPLASPRTDIGDNYLYFSLTKRGIDACRRSATSDDVDPGGNTLACTYLSAVLVNHFLLRATQLLMGTPHVAIVGFMILETALLAFSMLLTWRALLGQKLSFPSCIVLAGAGLMLVDSFGLSFYSKSIQSNLQSIWLIEPGPVRILNPSVFWSFGLLALAATLSHRERPGPLALSSAAALCALAGASSIAVGATLAGGFALCVAVWFVRRREFLWDLIVLGLALGLGLAWQLTQFSYFWTSELGQQVQHGIPTTFKVNFAFAWFLVPVMFGRITQSTDRVSDILAKCVVLAAALVGALCDSIELGSRLWLRGAVIFAFIGSAAWLWAMIGRWLQDLAVKARLRGEIVSLRSIVGPWLPRNPLAYSVLALVGLLLVFSQVRSYDPHSWRGFIDRDKHEVLAWLNERAKFGETIASTNNEDSFLIDFYTRAAPFVPLYGLTGLPFRETLRRYFHVISLIEGESEALARLQTARRQDLDRALTFLVGGVPAPYDYDAAQLIIFYDYIVYHNYNAHTRGLFATGSVEQNFASDLATIANEARGRGYRYRFLLARTGERLVDPLPFREVYRNASYVVFSVAAPIAEK